jgi:transcription elongation factor Elf1
MAGDRYPGRVQTNFKLTNMNKYIFNDLSFTCPYCGFVNKVKRHEASVGESHEFVYCDGCDQKIILRNNVKAEIKLTAFLIPELEYKKQKEVANG